MEEKVPPGIEDEDRESPVEPSFHVGPLFFRGAEGTIMLIDEEKGGRHRLRERNDGRIEELCETIEEPPVYGYGADPIRIAKIGERAGGT